MAEGQKMGLTPEEQRKIIIVEFVGGDKDGTTYRSDSGDKQEFQMCMGYYVIFSQGGKIGSGIRGVSEAAILELQDIVEETPDGPRLIREPTFKALHVYRVTDRLEDDERIVVRYTYMGSDGS